MLVYLYIGKAKDWKKIEQMKKPAKSHPAPDQLNHMYYKKKSTFLVYQKGEKKTTWTY